MLESGGRDNFGGFGRVMGGARFSANARARLPSGRALRGGGAVIRFWLWEIDFTAVTAQMDVEAEEVDARLSLVDGSRAQHAVVDHSATPDVPPSHALSL